jgi:hypothetical protein
LPVPFTPGVAGESVSGAALPSDSVATSVAVAPTEPPPPYILHAMVAVRVDVSAGSVNWPRGLKLLASR